LQGGYKKESAESLSDLLFNREGFVVSQKSVKKKDAKECFSSKERAKGSIGMETSPQTDAED